MEPQFLQAVTLPASPSIPPGPVGRHFLAVSILMLCLGGNVLRGQTPSDKDNGGLLTSEEVSATIEKLNSTSYREREHARWLLGQSADSALPAIQQALQTANHHTGAELVDIVTEMAMRSDSNTQMAAMRVLRTTAQRLTSVGGMAGNALSAISELQEGQAMEMLIHHGAYIGPRNFSLNGKKGLIDSELSLHISEKFSGEEDAINWIPYLASVETVCLEGLQIDRKYLAAIAEMKSLRNVKLKHVKISPDDLQTLSSVPLLEHIGLIYSDVGDEMLPVLLDLPVSGSIKLYGTDITKATGQRLKDELDDLEIFIGQGGFLGVGPMFLSSTRINEVTQNSAAEKADIRHNDVITHINNVPVKTFDDLRNELGKYEAEEEIEIMFERLDVPFKTTAKLQEEP